MSDSRSLFDGADVVGITFDAAPLDHAALTDVDALHRIADEIDVVFFNKKTEFSDVVRDAANELQRLRTELIVSEKARRVLARQLKAAQVAAGNTSEMDFVTVKEQAP